jgi:hypothetical protein
MQIGCAASRTAPITGLGGGSARIRAPFRAEAEDSDELDAKEAEQQEHETPAPSY